MERTTAIAGMTSRSVTVGQRQVFTSEAGSGYPLLMLHGGGPALQRCMPNCDLYLFCRTSHRVQWERAEAFNTVVSSFLVARTQRQFNQPRSQ